MKERKAYVYAQKACEHCYDGMYADAKPVDELTFEEAQQAAQLEKSK